MELPLCQPRSRLDNQAGPPVCFRADTRRRQIGHLPHSTTSTGRAPERSHSRSGEIGNTLSGVPAAAHT